MQARFNAVPEELPYSMALATASCDGRSPPSKHIFRHKRLAVLQRIGCVGHRLPTSGPRNHIHQALYQLDHSLGKLVLFQNRCLEKTSPVFRYEDNITTDILVNTISLSAHWTGLQVASANGVLQVRLSILAIPTTVSARWERT